MNGILGQTSFPYSVGGNIIASGGRCQWHKELLVLFLNIGTWGDPGPALPGFVRAQVSQGRGNSNHSGVPEGHLQGSLRLLHMWGQII